MVLVDDPRQSISMGLQLLLAVLILLGINPYVSHAATRNIRLRKCDVKTDLMPDALCQNLTCKQTAQEFLWLIDNQVKPCDDFYELTCGRWEREVPPNHAHWSVLEAYKQRLQDTFTEILEKDVQVDDPAPVTLAKKAYKICSNNDSDIVEPRLKRFLDRLGGWPLLNKEKLGYSNWDSFLDKPNWKLHASSWTRLLVQTTRHFRSSSRVFPLFQVSVIPDPRNPATNIIKIGPAPLVLDSHVAEGKEAEAYRQYVARAALALAWPRSPLDLNVTQLAEDSAAVVHFETKLAEMEVENGVEITTVRDLPAKMVSYSVSKSHSNEENENFIFNLDWIKTLIAIFGDYVVNNDYEVLIENPDYFRKLLLLLTETPTEITANYVMWKIVQHMAHKSTEQLRQEDFNFRRALTGVDEEMSSRSEMCTRIVSTGLPFAMLHEFNKLNQNGEDQTRAWHEVALLVQVRGAAGKVLAHLSERLARLPDTRAHLQAHEVAVHVGAPHWLADRVKLENYHEKILAKGAEDFILTYEQFDASQSQQLNLPNNQSQWDLEEFGFNYNPWQKILTIPATVLQKPFFDVHNIPAINSGRLNFMIAAALIRGQALLDLSVLSMNEDNDTNTEDCHMKKLSEITGAEMVGALDNKLASLALDVAYATFWDEEARDKRLAAISSVDAQKLFFFSYATLWCKHARSETHTLNTNANHRLLMLHSLANNRNFSEAFSCPLGSRMNPEHQCHHPLPINIDTNVDKNTTSGVSNETTVMLELINSDFTEAPASEPNVTETTPEEMKTTTNEESSSTTSDNTPDISEDSSTTPDGTPTISGFTQNSSDEITTTPNNSPLGLTFNNFSITSDNTAITAEDSSTTYVKIPSITENISTPSDEMSSENSSTTSDESTITPEDSSTISDGATTIHENSNSTTDDTAFTTEQSSNVNEVSATTPEFSSATSDVTKAALEYLSTTSEDTAPTPENSNTTSDEKATTAEDCRTTSDAPPPTPERSSSIPLTRHQTLPRTQSFIPLTSQQSLVRNQVPPLLEMQRQVVTVVTDATDLSPITSIKPPETTTKIIYAGPPVNLTNITFVGLPANLTIITSIVTNLQTSTAYPPLHTPWFTIFFKFLKKFKPLIGLDKI